MSEHGDARGDVTSAASCGDTRPHGHSAREAHATLGSLDVTSSLDHGALGGAAALGVGGYGGYDEGSATAAGARMSEHDDARGVVTSAASCGGTLPHGRSARETHATLGSLDFTSSLDYDTLGGSAALGVGGYGDHDAGSATAAGAVVSEHDGARGDATSTASCGDTRPHGHSARETLRGSNRRTIMRGISTSPSTNTAHPRIRNRGGMSACGTARILPSSV